MTHQARASVLLIISFVLLFNGCSNFKKTGNKIEYYALEYSSPVFDDLDNPLPYVIRTAHFTVSPEYGSSRIVYGEKSYKRDSYLYLRWRANPGDLVAHFLNRDLRQSGLFKGAVLFGSGAGSSHMIEGTVDEFYEKDLDTTWKAVLTVSITLMAEGEKISVKKILFQKSYAKEETCVRKDPQALAEAMSRAMGKMTTDVIRDIYGFLKDLS